MIPRHGSEKNNRLALQCFKVKTEIFSTRAKKKKKKKKEEEEKDKKKYVFFKQ